MTPKRHRLGRRGAIAVPVLLIVTMLAAACGRPASSASSSAGTISPTAGLVTTTPAGIGTLPEEPAIRAIITNDVTDQSSQTLLSQSGRNHLQQQILNQIKTTTDVKVTGILFTDLAVQ